MKWLTPCLGWLGTDREDRSMSNTPTNVSKESVGLTLEGGGDVGRAQQDLTPPT